MHDNTFWPVSPQYMILCYQLSLMVGQDYIILKEMDNAELLTGVSISPEVCCASACKSICGESSTIRCTDIWMNSSNESNCCRTNPFSSK